MLGRAKLRHIWNRLTLNYWTVPSTMVVVAIGLAFLLPWVDHAIDGTRSVVPDWVYGGGPEGARLLLSTIAGSMITVAALTFSITIVGLSTASQQFGPRLIRNFIADRGYQVVLGTFLAAFLYCLLALRTIRSSGSDEFVPYISVAVGIAFAVAGVFVLVYFIQHAASSIRAEHLVARTGRELRAAIDRLFPEVGEREATQKENGHKLPEGFPSGATEVPADESGYIQAIDQSALVKLASENDLIFRLEHRPGHFIIQEAALLEAWPDKGVSKDLREEVNECFVLGTQRSLSRDVESAVDQLVEIALRSLSPGINDPDTAIACIDQLADALAQAGERPIPPAILSHEGEVRLVSYPLTYNRLVEAAFSRIRQYGRDSVVVTLRLLEALASIGPRIQHESHRAALMHQAQMIWRASEESIPEPDDLKLVEARFRAVERVLAQEDAS